MPAAMPDPLAAKIVFPGDPEPGAISPLAQDPTDFLPERRRHPLIGVDVQNPVPPGLVLGAVLGPGKTLPGFLKNLHLEFPGDFQGSVPAARIHQNDLIGKADAFQAVPEILFLVKGNEGYGEHGGILEIFIRIINS
jgi:hypothetical protein